MAAKKKTAVKGSDDTQADLAEIKEILNEMADLIRQLISIQSGGFV